MMKGDARVFKGVECMRKGVWRCGRGIYKGVQA